MKPNQVARLVIKTMMRSESYKRFMTSIEMEHAMCSHYGVPFTLPVDTMYERLYNEAADIVAQHLKRSAGEVLWCLDQYLRLPVGPRY